MDEKIFYLGTLIQNKLRSILDFSFIKGFFSYTALIFLPINEPLTILAVLTFIDLCTGAAKGIKLQTFNSERLKRGANKFILYAVAIIAARLLELLFSPDTIWLSGMFIYYLAATEFFSILENLVLMGVPLPSNFFDLIGKQVKIKALEGLISKSKNVSGSLQEIYKIMTYHLPKIHNDDLRKILTIKFSVWGAVLKSVSNLKCTGEQNLWLKVKLILESAITEINDKWIKEDISPEKIKWFKQNYDEKIENLLSEMQKDSFCEPCPSKTGQSNDECFIVKRDRIYKRIIMVAYEVMTDSLVLEREAQGEKINP